MICSKNMEKMMSMLLMLVTLAVFIHSSEAAVKCYNCHWCDIPWGECQGEVCITVKSEVSGAFTIYGITVLVRGVYTIKAWEKMLHEKY